MKRLCLLLCFVSVPAFAEYDYRQPYERVKFASLTPFSIGILSQISWQPPNTGSGGSGSPGGSNTQVQYNNSSAFGGITNFTSDGTNITSAVFSTAAPKPSTAAGIGLGTTALPWLNLIVGSGANNTWTFSGTATGNNAITLPDRSATLATTTGTLTSGNCAKFDVNGNIVDNGSACNTGAGGASTALDNLAAVAINTSLLPASSNAIDAGSDAKQFRTLYVGTSVIFEGSTADANETVLSVVDPTADTTWQIPALPAATYIFANVGSVTLGGDVTNATTSYADVTGMSFSIAANTNYDVKCWFSYDANATTTGLTISWTGPASPTASRFLMETVGPQGTAEALKGGGNDTPASAATANSVSTSGNVAIFDGVWQNGANAGTLQMRFASEVAVANAIVLKQGSICKYSAF